MIAIRGRQLAPRVVLLLWGLLAVAGPGATLGHDTLGTPADDQKQPASPDGREEDRSAIRAAMQSFVEAFEARDAKALAAQWTAEGEYRNELGVTVRVREALTRGFERFFAETPEIKAEVRPATLRFLSGDVAIEDGIVTIRRGPAEPETEAS